MESQQILQFWFGLASDNLTIASQQAALWWSKDELVDTHMRDHYADWVRAAAQGELAHWQQEPASYLALILLLDQFPRNIYRSSAASFAHDAQALQLTQQGLANGIDQRLSPIQRVFFYLPLEHAEDQSAQAQAVALLSALEQSVTAPERNLFANYTSFARRHQEVIQRFGRFPHRNVILGRRNTAAEIEYLQEPGAGF